MYFTDQNNDRIGRFNRTTGAFTFWTVPTPDSTALGMVRGPDGDLYFTERSVDKVGRFDPTTDLFTDWTLDTPIATRYAVCTWPDDERTRAYDRPVLIYSMSVSVDGYIADRNGAFGWSAPSDELFAFHLARVRDVGTHLCGRRLYETMLPWESDPSMRDLPLGAEFADVWTALPKVVFSRTLRHVRGNARLTRASVTDEIVAALEATDKDVEIGGAGLAAEAFTVGLIDELRIFRVPIVVGGGTPFLPPVTEDAALDLIETRTFDSRVVYERYRTARRNLC